MNALNLYVTACRKVLQSGADDASAWADISRLLSCLRQALTCCVCEKILVAPTSSPTSNCHHNVCKGCLGGKIRVKPPCDRCTDSSNFTENVQVRIVLQCYKKLCEYIVSSSLHKKWGNLNGGTTSNLAELVQEGAGLSCDRSCNTARQVSTAGLKTAISNLLPIISKAKEQSGAVTRDAESSIFNGNGNIYSVTVTKSNSTKIMIKRNSAESSESEASNFDPAEGFSNSNNKNTISVELPKSSRPKKRGCRCGLATRNPGQLTCCGQRCLCYVDRKACDQCSCRGCRNPNKYFVKGGLVQASQSTICEQPNMGVCIETTVGSNGESQS